MPRCACKYYASDTRARKRAGIAGGLQHSDGHALKGRQRTAPDAGPFFGTKSGVGVASGYESRQGRQRVLHDFALPHETASFHVNRTRKILRAANVGHLRLTQGDAMAGINSGLSPRPHPHSIQTALMQYAVASCRHRSVGRTCTTNLCAMQKRRCRSCYTQVAGLSYIHDHDRFQEQRGEHSG